MATAKDRYLRKSYSEGLDKARAKVVAEEIKNTLAERPPEEGDVRQYLVARNAMVREMLRDRAQWDWRLSPDDILERLGGRFEGVRGAEWWELGEVKQCYQNAWAWAEYEGEEWRYVEGMAYGIIPMHHAWVANQETGEVIDLTWCQGNNLSLGTDYLGIEIPLDIVRWLMEEHDAFGVLECWWLLPEELKDRIIAHNERKPDGSK